MRNAKLSRSLSGRIGAGKAWFNMTSEGGRSFVPGKRALYSNLFIFKDRQLYPVKGSVAVYRPGITREIALAEIGDSRSHKRRISRVKKLFKEKMSKEKMALREGAML